LFYIKSIIFKLNKNYNNNIFLGYSIEWRNEWIHVHRSDVRCTNGIIHVIDKVLIDDNDIEVNAAITTKSITALVMVMAQCLVFYYFN